MWKPHTIPCSYWAQWLHCCSPLEPILQLQKCLVKVNGFTFRSFFYPFSLGMQRSKLYWQVEEKKKQVSWIVARLWHQLPIATGSALHKSGLPQPAPPGHLEMAAWGAYRDGGLPCRVPVLQQGFGQLPLGNNLHKETEGGDSGHIAAGLLNEVPSKNSPFSSAWSGDIYVYWLSKDFPQIPPKYRYSPFSSNGVWCKRMWWMTDNQSVRRWFDCCWGIYIKVAWQTLDLRTWR